MSESTSGRRFRRATVEDLPVIHRNYAHAREWMAAHGNPTQWGSAFPRAAVVEDDIARERTMLLVEGNAPCERVLAQFALCEGIDPTYVAIDGAWLDDDAYVTVHRLASSGLARRAAHDCLRWALDRHGNVRIDTHPHNAAMRHVLESEGFVRCGLIRLLDRQEDTVRIAYQRHEW